jgi:hypothetical protein
MSNKRAGKSEERSLIKKRRLAIRSGKKLYLSKSSSGSNKKEPTASIITSVVLISRDRDGIELLDKWGG